MLKNKLLTAKTVRNTAIIAGLVLMVSEPAMAQAWASKTNSVIQQIITGLKMLGVGIATMCVLWSAYQIIFGGKRLQDMVPFFIGAALFLAGPELVALFFGGK